MEVFPTQEEIGGNGNLPYPPRQLHDIMHAWFFVEQAIPHMIQSTILYGARNYREDLFAQEYFR